MADIATAYVQIEPTAKGISGSLSSLLGGEGTSAGNSFTSGFGRALGGLGKAAVGGIALVGTAVAAAGSKFLSSAGEVAEYGDNIDKMSQKMGISAEAYQEWDAVLQHSGTSMDAMSRGMNTLQKNAAGSAEKFAALGLSEAQVASMSTEDLFAATITGLQNMGEGADRTALANELLGGSAKELGALLNTSAEDTQAMRDRVRELGGVMSDEAVKSAAAYQDQLQDMQTAFQGLSRNMMSEFLPSLTTVMSGLTDIFTGNKEGGLSKISEGVKSLADGIIQALPQLLETASEILMALAQAILENLPTLIPVAVDLVMTFVDFIIQNLPLLIEAAAQLILELANGIAEALPQLIPTIVEVILTIVQYLIENIDLLIDAAVQLILGLAEGLINALPVLIEKIPEIVVAIVEALIENAPLLIQAMGEIAIQLIEAFIEALGPLVEKVAEVIKNVAETVKTKLAELPEKAKEKAAELAEKFVGALKEFPSKVKEVWDTILEKVADFGKDLCESAAQTAKDFAQDMVDGLKELPKKMVQLGKDIVDGIKQGISDAWDGIKEWFSQKSTSLVQGAQEGLKIGSPSKLFRDEVGVWIPAGIAEGIEDGISYIDSAMKDMTLSVMPEANPDLMGVSYAPTATNPTASITSGSDLFRLLAQYLPEIATGVQSPINVVQNDRGMFSAVREENVKFVTATGYHALA